MSFLSSTGMSFILILGDVHTLQVFPPMAPLTPLTTYLWVVRQLVLLCGWKGARKQPPATPSWARVTAPVWATGMEREGTTTAWQMAPMPLHCPLPPTSTLLLALSCWAVSPFPVFKGGLPSGLSWRSKVNLSWTGLLPAEQLVLCNPHTSLLPHVQSCLLIYPAHQAPENIWVWDLLFQTLALLDGEDYPALWENHCFKKYILVIPM